MLWQSGLPHLDVGQLTDTRILSTSCLNHPCALGVSRLPPLGNTCIYRSSNSDRANGMLARLEQL
ncbi:MAG: hypothetical protein KA296_07265 [Marinobacter sp.]|nr:hypothetical protein [Marinobacter sp.]